MHDWKMTEWKMHTMENDRKITHWKMTENTHLENAQPGKWQKIHEIYFSDEVLGSILEWLEIKFKISGVFIKG